MRLCMATGDGRTAYPLLIVYLFPFYSVFGISSKGGWEIPRFLLVRVQTEDA